MTKTLIVMTKNAEEERFVITTASGFCRFYEHKMIKLQSTGGTA